MRKTIKIIEVIWNCPICNSPLKKVNNDETVMTCPNKHDTGVARSPD